jgi:glycolate oxidase FAD binding subunit
MNNDLSKSLAEIIKQAHADRQALQIKAGNSKFFYGRNTSGDELSVVNHTGIIEYRASELVLTARSGTKLSEIEKALAENNQMLAYEPPMHTAASTLGGSIACGLSGPRRPFAGAARDFVLGTTIINGKGEQLKFGGQVMKNVAGYDASRLMAGAQGTLGVLLDVSIKVLPKPESEITLCFEQNFTKAHDHLREWILKGHPITGSCFYDGQLFVRLSSTENSTKKSHELIGGDMHANELWQSLRHQNHAFFIQHKNIWRVSLPPSAKTIETGQPQLTEWNGALRWIASDNELFTEAKNAGGHASKYPLNGKTDENIFQPLPSTMLALQQRLKKSFDPEGILNPGRLYPDL